ncbi:SurA N-terminal domain-containing protein [Bernardetia sp. OM2101]|uniref:SurA N-terminal domain-containing protein n=1 Tax=Bernardetia sp. OM2101 TaxID=3344876 RepID=UPI0035D09594
MSIITAIQKRTGLLLVVILGALAAFVLTDFIGSASRMGSDQIIGEIDGTEIKYQDFNNQLQIMRDRMEASQQTKINESQMPIVRNQTWNELVTEYALKPEWEKLGIIITKEEVVDMVQGNNVSPQIKQAFTDPKTGVFDKDQLIAFLKNPPTEQTIQMHRAFNAFEQELPKSRRNEKYENLLRKSVYVTKAEAKRRYEDETMKLDLKYLYVPYANIPDSTVTVTEDQIKEYYNSHKEEYDDVASISVEYVTIPIVPSKSDSADTKRYLTNIKDKFATTQNDTSFIAEHSQIEANFAELSTSNFPNAIKNQMGEEVVVGFVANPVASNGTYKMFKVVKELGLAVDSVKASHILFKTDGKSPEEKLAIETKAKEILAKAKSGGNFAELAKEYSEDGSKDKGGDLSWFGRGAMVKPFEDATFGATGNGVLPELVESRFGYHIIEVTGLTKKNKYLLASVSRLLDPSESTREALYRQAGDLASSKNMTEYEDRVKQYNLLSLQANDVKQNARSLNNIYDASIRQAIRWGFEENTKIGSVSNEVFDVDNQYIVMVLKSRTQKGIQPLSKVYEQVRREVIKEVKQKEILAKLEGKTGTLAELATAFGDQARVLDQQNYTYITNALNGVGFAPKAVGMAFGMEEGETSKPITDESGVLIMKVEKRTEAGEVADYAKYKAPLEEDRQQPYNSGGIIRAIKQLTDTEENIDSFY